MERYIENRSGKKLFCRIQGQGDPLVMIHGIMVDADFFTDMAGYLEKDFQVITYDRRGYSRSEKNEEYTLGSEVTDVIDILDALQISSAYIVGCSAGGVIGLKLAELYGQRVKRLAVHEPAIASLPGALDDHDKQIAGRITGFIHKGRYKRAAMEILADAAEFNEAENKSQAQSHDDPGKVEQHLENGALFMREQFLDAYNPEKSLLDYEKLKEFGRIDCLVGDVKDRMPVRAGEQLARLLGKMVFYGPGGHNGMQQYPWEYASILLGLRQIHKQDGGTE